MQIIKNSLIKAIPVIILLGIASTVQAQDFISILELENSIKIKEALDKGADPNVKMKDGEFALAYFVKSISAGRDLIIKELVNHGANVNIEILRGGGTALMYVTYSKNFDLIKLFVEKGADINKKTEYGTPPLHSAAGMEGSNGLKIAEYLIAHGADVNLVDSRGFTPIFNAIIAKNFDIVKKLVDEGADINYKQTKQKGEESPIHYMIKTGDLTMIKYFVDAGANINAKSRYGETPVYIAVDFNQKDVLEYLISKKANVNSKNTTGETPLVLAKRNENKDIINMLIKAGAK